MKIKERKMAPEDRYAVPTLKWLTGHNVYYHYGNFMNEFDCKQKFCEWNFVVTVEAIIKQCNFIVG